MGRSKILCVISWSSFDVIIIWLHCNEECPKNELNFGINSMIDTLFLQSIQTFSPIIGLCPKLHTLIDCSLSFS